MNRVLCVLVVVLMSFLSVSAYDQSSVMIQGFHWESHETINWFSIIGSKADDLAESGINMVWFPPSGAAITDEGYLPNRYYDQNSAYGSESELKSSIQKLHSKNILAIADIVINHRVGTSDWADFTMPEWGPDSVCSDDEWAFAKGSPDTGGKYHAARDIDHTKTYVQNDLAAWLSWMKTEIGYDGFRYDFVKGYDGYYTGKYNSIAAPAYSVGEYWDYLDLNNPNANRQQLCNWIDATGGMSSAFDFTTKGLLQQAVSCNEYWRMRDSEGKPAGLIGWWAEKSCTFVDNHDTGPSTGGHGGQNHWAFPSDKIMLGYAYILTHPGVPCIYWVHFYDWNLHDEIKKLSCVRKSAGITATSTVNIIAADSSKYAAIIDNKLAMKIGNGDWNPGNGWNLAASGNNYAVWTK